MSEHEGERCDLCNSVVDVRWSWLTPSPTATVEEAKAKHLPWMEDPEWSVCDTCHNLIMSDRRDGLLVRMLDSVTGMLMLGYNAEEEVFDKINKQDYVSSVHEVFWKYKTEHWAGLERRS